VDGHRSPISALELPDPDDRHVQTAAINCGANLIINFNLDDFPEHTLALWPWRLSSRSVFFGQLNLGAERVCIVMRQHRSSLKNPAKTVEEHRVTLEQQGLSRFSQAGGIPPLSSKRVAPGSAAPAAPLAEGPQDPATGQIFPFRHVWPLRRSVRRSFAPPVTGEQMPAKPVRPKANSSAASQPKNQPLTKTPPAGFEPATGCLEGSTSACKNSVAATL
jgi:hypothetical protein